MKNSLIYRLLLCLLGCMFFCNFSSSLTVKAASDSTASTVLISGSEFYKTVPDTAVSVVFTDVVAKTENDLTDVSKAGDGGVVSWLEGDVYYVSTQRKGVLIDANADSSYMFYHLSNLTDIDFSNLDTGSVTTMHVMFSECKGLTELDLSGFNTENVTNMRSLFYNCSALKRVNLSGFDTSKVTTMCQMFYNCKDLISLDLSDFNTSNVTTMYKMFAGCRSLVTADVSGFKTDSLEIMYKMFNCCSSLAELDLSGFDTAKVTDMNYMFSYCTSLKKLDLSNFNTAKVTVMCKLFYHCSSLESLDLSGFDTNSVIDMTHMFSYCSRLQEVGVGEKFNFAGSGFCINSYLPVPDSAYIDGADGCWYNAETMVAYRPEEIPGNTAAVYKAVKPEQSVLSNELITGTEFYKIVPDHAKKIIFTDMKAKADCSITDLSAEKDGGVVSWLEGDVYYVSTQRKGVLIDANADSSYMFYHLSNLTDIDFSNLDTSSVTNMYVMFSGCSGLTTLDLTGFDTSSVTNMRSMFYNCSSLEELDLSGFNTGNVKNMCQMFYRCLNLKTLNLSTFDTHACINMNHMFYFCNHLQNVTLGELFSFSGNGTITTTTQYLPYPKKTYIEGADGYWYNAETLKSYKPNAIPDNIGATYVACPELAKK